MNVDLYAGPGGWDLAGESLGLRFLGFEVDPVVCGTRSAAGFWSVCADLSVWPYRNLWDVSVLVASPPCQSFSRAGRGEGRSQLDDLVAWVDAGWGAPSVFDEKSRHVLVCGLWVEALKPKVVCFEQVPSVLPVWEAWLRRFESIGYEGWTGVLNAADFGVPQLRKRAFLCAVLEPEITPKIPVATHNIRPEDDLFGGKLPYVTVTDALGWYRKPGETDWTRPGGTKVLRNDQTNFGVNPDWPSKRPATTIAGRFLLTDAGQNANRFNKSKKSRNDGYIITPQEAGILQGFPPFYPWQGFQKPMARQIGNAVPPQLARAVLQSAAWTPKAGPNV